MMLLSSFEDKRQKMIQVLLTELMAQKGRQEGRRITYEEVSRATGIHRTTLTKIADPRGHNVRTDIVDKLCVYFEVPVEKY